MMMRPHISARMKSDLHERFLKFRTIRGLIKIPAAIFIAFVTYTHLQYAIQAVFWLGAAYYVVDGLRDVFVNPVKQEIAHKRLLKRRERLK